ncbi:MAG TPA: SprT-like domain-containing protein [Chthoniobacteraceae bacterium]|jgi:hypothetical protein
MANRKRKLATAKLPLQRQFAFQEKGEFFDLRKIFDKLNAQYFRNQLKGYSIVWGRKRRQRPREYVVFGTIQEEDRMIRIHPLLDRAFVPTWFLEYVVYHEMCHAVVPDRFDESGRRIVHHEKFFERERQFRWFRRAKQWEDENLARFLR